MDLRISITDENGDELARTVVHQDGSDSEGASKIIAGIAREFTIDVEAARGEYFPTNITRTVRK